MILAYDMILIQKNLLVVKIAKGKIDRCMEGSIVALFIDVCNGILVVVEIRFHHRIRQVLNLSI